MSYKLLAGEQIVYQGQQHWLMLVPSAVILFITSTILTGPRGIAWPFMIALAWFVVKIIEFRSSSFVVTNKRVIVRTGWSTKNNFELLLGKVEAVNVSQSFSDLGTVTVVGSGGSSVKIKNLKSPDDFKHAIQGEASR